MLALLLKVSAVLGILLAGSNGYFKLFFDDAALTAVQGSTGRGLDPNLVMLAFSLIFFALAKIIDNTNPPETD